MRTLQKAALAAAAAGLATKAARKPRKRPVAAEPHLVVPAQRSNLLGLQEEDSLVTDQEALDAWLSGLLARLG